METGKAADLEGLLTRLAEKIKSPEMIPMLTLAVEEAIVIPALFITFKRDSRMAGFITVKTTNGDVKVSVNDWQQKTGIKLGSLRFIRKKRRKYRRL